MRALFLASAIYGLEGGLERFNRRFLRALAELREEGRLEEVDAVALSDAPSDGARAPEGSRLFGCGGSRLRTVLSFLRLVVTRRPRVVVYGYVGFAPLALLVRILNPGAVHLLIVHGIEVWRKPSWIRGWSTRHGLDVILAVSAFTVNRMAGFFGLREEMFRVFPNCLDTDDLTDPAARGGAGSAGSTLISVARLSVRDRYKNIDKVILALPRVLEEFPDARYDIVGEGPLRPELERLAGAHGVAARVRFLGWTDDAARDAAYADADIFVLPSTGEGFGIVFLEAWSFGLPCIASNRDAASEVIRDGVDGYCVDPDPESIAGAIGRLLADPDRRRKMGEAGRARLITDYSHARFRENLGRILGEVS